MIKPVGLLLTALNADRIDELTANSYLQTWIDDYGYYVSYRAIEAYR